MTRGRAIATWSGALAIVAASQLPYYRVWTMGASFNYDAFTTFSTWFVTLQRDMLAGRNLFSIYQETFPGLVQPAYLFGNFIRQVLAFVLDNTFLAHAKIQALHSVLTVIACAMLFRSFGLPLFYAALGSFVFTTSGLNVSLSQHVVRHEAYLYLAIVLLCLRLLIRDYTTSDTLKRLLLTSASVVALVSLTSWAHETVHYFLPIAGWVIVHVVQRWRTLEVVQRRNMIVLLAGIAVAVAICDAPRLLFFFEMSQINKTLIHSYAETGHFAETWSLYWLALLTPNAMGTNDATTPFVFGDDRNLSYVFAGSLALSCATLVLGNLWRQRAYREALVIVAILVMLLGFGFGVGSPVHWIFCKVFPPLGMMRHHNYGTSLAYLVTGYLTARGIYELVTRPSRLVVLAGVLPCVVSLFLAAALFADFSNAGLTGSEHDQFLTLTRDLGRLWLVQGAFVGIGMALVHVPWDKLAMARAVPFVAGLALAAMVTIDIVHPALDAHFSPRQRPSASWARFDGEMSMVNPFRDHLTASSTRLPWRPIRVLPIGVGWFGNTLPIFDVAAVSGSDTQGNRFLEERLVDVRSLNAPRDFAADFGIDYVWVANSHSWAAALSQQPEFQLAVDVGVLGKVYRFDRGSEPVLTQIEPAHYNLSWWAPEGIIARKDGWLGPRYVIDLTAAGVRELPAEVSLPILWLSKFGVHNAVGDRLPKMRDALGRLAIRVSSPNDLRIEVAYPSALYAAAISFAVILYSIIALSLIGALAFTLGGIGSRRLRKSSP